MKHTIEGVGKIEIIEGVLFVNDKTLSDVLKTYGMDNLSLCGSIRIEIFGRKPAITVRKAEQA